MSNTTRQEQPPSLEVHAPAPIQWGALFWCVVAMILLALSLMVREHARTIAWLSLAPALLAMALIVTRKGAFSAVLHERGIEMFLPYELSLPWEKIQAVIPLGRKPANPYKPPKGNYSLRIVYEEGSFDIPATVNADSEQLLNFIITHVPASGSREMPRKLAGYLQMCLEQLGSEQVLSYRARRQLAVPWSKRKRFLALGLALAVCGAIWIATLEPPLVLVLEAGTGCSAFIFLLLSTPLNTIYPSGLRNAGLVLTPQGLAISQKEIFGYAEWSEISAMDWGKPVGETDYLSRRAIILTIQEHEFPIYDIYDRPGLLIYRKMLEYWQAARAVPISRPLELVEHDE